jgi:hypothetical protein
VPASAAAPVVTVITRHQHSGDRRPRCEHGFAERDDQKETASFRHVAAGEIHMVRMSFV